MLGMTGAVKNQFGIVPGLMKPEFHALYPEVSDFCNMLIDLNEFIKPRLAIIDGIVGMEGNGPSAGTAREIGCLIASDSVYHADVAMAYIMGLAPADMPLIHAAYRARARAGNRRRSWRSAAVGRFVLEILKPYAGGTCSSAAGTTACSCS